MRIALIVGTVLGLVYLLWVVVPDIYLERKFPSPRPVKAAVERTQPVVPKQGRYRVTIENAKIFPTNEKGSCWDPCMRSSRELLSSLSKQLQWATGNGWQVVMGSQPGVIADQSSKQPDVFVELKFGNQPMLRTNTVNNSVTPQWGVFHDLTLSSTDSLRVYVWDQDPINNELIGYYAAAQIPAIYLNQGGTWKLRFKRVYELQLTFKPLLQKPPQILQPGRYRITILSGLVRKHKDLGKSWDLFQGAPDPYAIVRVGPHQLETPVSKDTLYPTWNHSRILTLKGNEHIKIWVYDKDLAKKDELIGACNVGALHQIKLQEGVLLRASCGYLDQINIKFDRIL